MTNQPTYRTIDITDPQPGRIVRRKAYWACVDKDPAKALFYRNAPQCNNNEAILQWALKRGNFKDIPNVGIVYLDIAYSLLQQ